MAAPAPEAPLALNDEQRTAGAALGRSIGIVSMALLALALLRIVTGVLRFKEAKLLALVDVIEGVITGVMGLVLMNARDSAAFMTEVKGYEKPHFLNLMSSLDMYGKVLIALAVFVGLTSLLRLVF
jgi:hypothetical protein